MPLRSKDSAGYENRLGKARLSSFNYGGEPHLVRRSRINPNQTENFDFEIKYITTKQSTKFTRIAKNRKLTNPGVTIELGKRLKINY